MGDLYIQIAKDILGIQGKMISASKSGYAQTFPDHIVVFNANIFVGKTKIWFGDLDVTDSVNDLKELAESTGSEIHILFEMDGRFDKERNPYLDNFVVKFSPGGEVKINPALQERINNGELKI